MKPSVDVDKDVLINQQKIQPINTAINVEILFDENDQLQINRNEIEFF